MGTIPVAGIRRADPLLRDQPLPLTAVFYPGGFPLHLSTNSRDVIEAANESWGEWRAAFDRDPIVMHVMVEPGGDLAAPPRFRMRDHLIHAVSDANNFAAADSRTLTTSICVSEKTAADHGWLRWFFMESIAYLLLSQRYLTAIHAACLVRDGKGILLCGASNAGKSTLAFACARAGFTYVTDDGTWLLNGADDRTAIGRPYQIRFRNDAVRHFPELAGRTAIVRPNGKISIEVALREFPNIHIASRCRIDRVVFLKRDAGDSARLERVSQDEALELITCEMFNYGDEANALQQATVEQLVGAPAFHMYYRSLEDGIRLLSEIP
jgi:hypothetical protein